MVADVNNDVIVMHVILFVLLCYSVGKGLFINCHSRNMFTKHNG